MRDEDKRAIIKLYEDRYAAKGYGVETVGWGSRQDQELRFEVLCDIADLSGCSVCDIGCGFGDLHPYLAGRYANVSYTGVDISPSLVAKGQELYPQARFLCADILETELDERFDYLVLSGALNFRVDDNVAWAQEMITKMYSIANRGVAVNFLTSYVNFERPLNYHYSPEKAFAFARTLTKWVTLRHDYPLWEFTLHLYRDPRAGRPAHVG